MVGQTALPATSSPLLTLSALGVPRAAAEPARGGVVGEADCRVVGRG